MHRLLIVLFILLLSAPEFAFSQSNDSTEIFLLTCQPGKEVATVYGHSAIRVVKSSIGFDEVYSWGVYDFNTPNFVWKFAKGRLNYLVDAIPYDYFIQEYVSEQRNVVSQKINLTSEEKDILISLINNNLRPENKFYLYDFFYDNCATRIRDLIEKTLGNQLVYPNENTKSQPTFRERINEVQKPIQWLTFGTDLLIGTAGDKKAGFRERMFLPEDLAKNLSRTMRKAQGNSIPLLQNPVKILDFAPADFAGKPWQTPLFIFSILLIIILLLSILVKPGLFLDNLDRFIFLVFSVLSIVIVFFTFFTDHQVMRMNLNIIWLNPIFIPAFVALLGKQRPSIWLKIILTISLLLLFSLAIIPQAINIACIPLILIVVLRSGMRLRPARF
jgi:hypothetical protein